MTHIPKNLLSPREKLQNMLLKGETEKVLKMAGMLHGHYCPGLAFGVKAVVAGFNKLGIKDNSGMEEIMAVVECNNCFVDGIQFAAGCSLGNNSLVYKDIGKTAVTFYKRNTADAVRVSLNSFQVNTANQQEQKEGDALFEKAVKKREKLTQAESKRLKELWIQRSFATVKLPDEQIFTIKSCPAPQLPFAPIFDSLQCSICGEKTMETKAVFRNKEPVCITCSNEEYRILIGKGITTGKGLGT